MPSTFSFDAPEAEQLLLADSFTKLCTVPFPIEAARAEVVMHYDTQCNTPSLISLCNAYIHYRRVNPPSTLRLNGVPTKKYAVVPCSDYDEQEVLGVVDTLNAIGYYAYTTVVNSKVKLYISWDPACEPIEGAEESNV